MKFLIALTVTLAAFTASAAQSGQATVMTVDVGQFGVVTNKLLIEGDAAKALYDSLGNETSADNQVQVGYIGKSKVTEIRGKNLTCAKMEDTAGRSSYSCKMILKGATAKKSESILN